MSRRSRPDRACIAASLLFAAVASSCLRPAAGAQRGASEGARPNLLLVTIDTLRADRLGCYGYPGIRTPVIDGLAKEGTLFERAFSPVPLTLPSHCSVLTGTYPSFHGVRDNSGFVLSSEQVTLAEILKGAGYETAAVMGAFVLDSKFGLAQGFDHYYDNFDLSRYETVSPGYIQRTADDVVDEALRWLGDKPRGRRAAPFFLWVHIYDPHDPYTPPEPYRSRHRDSPYDGEIEFADASLGRLLDGLRQGGSYGDTLVVVLGDHGESLGEHGESKHGFFIYNATLHVPLIFRLPKGVRAGRRIAEHVSLVDVLPTILQILEVGRGENRNVQGKGLLSLMLGKAPNYRPEIYAECFYPRLQFGWSDLRALITDRYKYILAPAPELYDLREDFAEGRNLAPQATGLANQLRENLRSVRRRYGAPPGGAVRKDDLDPETREKLRSLGYISYSMGDTGDDEQPGLRDPKQQIGAYQEIVALFEQGSRGEYLAVIPRYERILQEQPTLKIVQYKLAQAYFQTGNYEAALAGYKKAIALGGDVSLATFDLAQTYLKLGRVDEAILGFRRTVETDPTHHRARTNLGLLLKNQGKLQEAIEQLEAAVALAPRAFIALNNLGIAYSMVGRHHDAENVLRRAVEYFPKEAALRANLAAVLYRMGRTDEARQEMDRARELNPKLGRTSP